MTELKIKTDSCVRMDTTMTIKSKNREVSGLELSKDEENTKLKLPPNDEKEKGKYIGSIASLHTHSFKPGNLMKSVQKMELVAGKGILNNPRYYQTINKTSGYQNINHLSLIERDQITDLVEEMAVYEELMESGKKTPELLPGIIRSNIEIIACGLFLIDVIGYNVRIGDSAVISIYKARVTCKRMDEIYPGLKAMTRNNKLGVIAEIIQSGEIKVGDSMYVVMN